MDATPPTTENSAQSVVDTSRNVRKRNRIPLSCAPCRHRKLKCNRASPTCDNCNKRGIAASCSYSVPTTRKERRQSKKKTKQNVHAPEGVQERIDRIEGLLMSLVNANAQAAAQSSPQVSIDSESDASSRSHYQSVNDEDEDCVFEEEREVPIGLMKVDAKNKRTLYTGEAHWAALLNNISEVQTHLQTNEEQYERQGLKIAQTIQSLAQHPGPALLFGAVESHCREEILSHLPSRYTCDIIMAQYFKTSDPAIHIIHRPTFQKQYNQHWQSPTKTPIVWIAMLFSLMRLAMLTWKRDCNEPPEFHGKCNDLASFYRTQVTSALILADYTKPHAHLIETLIFHLYGEYASNKDAQTSTWVLVAMVARLAMGMGFHRDSKWFPNISPFQGEMRRRAWTFIRQSDILFSFQSGLPFMIRIGDSDTDLPHNLIDSDFDEETAVLPASRPASSTTPISYMIAKASLAFGFGRVLEEVNHSRGKKSHDEILAIDRNLRELYSNIPAHLRLRPMAEQNGDPISLIMARFSLATLHHKALCVLHRNYLHEAHMDAKLLPSRKPCLESAMTLLSFQAIQHQETAERVTLESHQTSLTTNDFLLAATIICMDLYNYRETTEVSNGADAGSHGVGSSAPRRADLLEALKRSRDIWHELRDRSMDAYKASEVLGMLLTRLTLRNNEQEALSMATNMGNGSSQLSMPGLSGWPGGQQLMINTGYRLPSRADSPVGNTQVRSESQRAEQGQSYNIFNGQGLGKGAPSFSLFGMTDGGNYINSDWASAYMPPPSLGDPVANLWASNSCDNNIFTTGDTWSLESNLTTGPLFYASQDLMSSGIPGPDPRERVVDFTGDINDAGVQGQGWRPPGWSGGEN